MPVRFPHNALCCREGNNSKYREPVRRVITRQTKRVIGRFPSRKSGGMVPWESQIERDALYLLEVDTSVVSFFAQPERLHLVVQGQPRQHVPDLLVCEKGGASWFAEIKPDEDAILPENRAIFAAAAEVCLQRNFGYRVLLRSWIRREPRLSNAKLLLRYSRIVPGIDHRIRVLGLLESRSGTLADLRQGLGASQAFGEIMALLLDGTISTDLNQPISDASLLWLTRGRVDR